MTEPKPIVLITGCSAGGIGFALCEAFAPRAHTVYATSRKLDSMTGFSFENIKRLELDVCDSASVKRAVEKVIEEQGRIDIVVSNAGMGAFGPILDIPVERAEAAFKTNYFGSHRLVQAVAPHMFERRSGKIILVGSIAGIISAPWNASYCASKAALHSFADTLRMECAPFNVQVQTLIPGFVRSNIINNMEGIFTLSPKSVYMPWAESIYHRFSLSQRSPNCMPTRTFADTVVKELLKKKLRWWFMLGGNARWTWFLSLMPRWWALRQMGKGLL